MRSFVSLISYAMHVITRLAIRQYAAQNAQAAEALNLWFHIVDKAEWSDYNAIKEDFPSCDYITDNRYVFNIKGNHYRLLAMIFFPAQQVYIRGIFTHAQYSKLNKADISRL